MAQGETQMRELEPNEDICKECGKQSRCTGNDGRLAFYWRCRTCEKDFVTYPTKPKTKTYAYVLTDEDKEQAADLCSEIIDKLAIEKKEVIAFTLHHLNKSFEEVYGIKIKDIVRNQL